MSYLASWLTLARLHGDNVEGGGRRFKLELAFSYIKQIAFPEFVLSDNITADSFHGNVVKCCCFFCFVLIKRAQTID